MSTGTLCISIFVAVLVLCSRLVVTAPHAADEKPSASAPKADPEPDFSKFPALKGKVEHVLGHVQSYIPPKAGEPFHLEFKDILKISQLSFDSARKSYIPLQGKVATQVHYFTNDAFASMRLAWTHGRNKVTVDLNPIPGSGNPKRVFVWVVVQSDVITGIALIDCEYEGVFPRRPK